MKYSLLSHCYVLFIEPPVYDIHHAHVSLCIECDYRFIMSLGESVI
jgi:hypothetical protein